MKNKVKLLRPIHWRKLTGLVWNENEVPLFFLSAGVAPNEMNGLFRK